MLEWIDAPDDVIAAKVAGKITNHDLGAIMDRLDHVMARHQKIHVFVETQSIEGIELSALPEYLSRAVPLFASLTRFGRVAVVADQRWVRAGTRLESALLPGIEYRTFVPADREQAISWVAGRKI